MLCLIKKKNVECIFMCHSIFLWSFSIILLFFQRKRLEERRLPQSLLEAAAAEQKTRLARREQAVNSKQKRGKRTNFSDSEDDGFVENVDEGEPHFMVFNTYSSLQHIKARTNNAVCYLYIPDYNASKFLILNFFYQFIYCYYFLYF